ncbi:hypothetical protein [Streptomyces sp. NPDC015680]|uniref:hypothetical protein n=1 Tax=Streptomyces sp. NPDC015680 TaxID=3364962 RepID=UPI003702D3F3
MTAKTPEGLQAQRAQLIASTGLTEEVLRKRAEAFQLYPEHADAWSTVEGIDYLLNDAEKDTALTEAQALAGRWEEKYFEMVEKYTPVAQRDAALQSHLPALRRAVETLPAKCMYHDETHPHGTWREACCDTGVPARRRALAEEALNALTKEKTA